MDAGENTSAPLPNAGVPAPPTLATVRVMVVLAPFSTSAVLARNVALPAAVR